MAKTGVGLRRLPIDGLQRTRELRELLPRHHRARDEEAEHATHGKHVRGRAYFPRTLHLLGSSEVQLPETVHRAGHPVIARDDGDPEVDQLHLPAGADQHVLRRNVAMNDPLTVGERKPREHLLDDVDGVHHVHRAPIHGHTKVLSEDVFHYEGGAVRQVGQEVVDLRDVSVRQPLHRKVFPAQPFPGGGICEQRRWQHLHGHGLPGVQAPTRIYPAVSTMAQPRPEPESGHFRLRLCELRVSQGLHGFVV